MHLWQKSDWPHWHCDLQALSELLATAHRKQSRLLGKMESLSFKLRDEARLRIITEEALRTSEIEGEHLDFATVRSSVAQRLGIDIGALAPTDRAVDGLVAMIIDATSHHEKPLTEQRLLGWHAALFPTGYSRLLSKLAYADEVPGVSGAQTRSVPEVHEDASTGTTQQFAAEVEFRKKSSGMTKIRTGQWRDDATGPMQVVSGPLGREHIHYEVPPAPTLKKEMELFLTWLEHEKNLDPILMAARAHLWFVSIHPFDDGNGRIGRALSDMLLARSDKAACPFYSLSAQIQRERKDYYLSLEYAQHGTMDDTEWLRWFLGCLERAIDQAEETLATILMKARFWNHWSGTSLNKRQILLINRLLDGFHGKLTSSKWGTIAKCSPDTALRDIQELLTLGILEKEAAGGRSTSYIIPERNWNDSPQRLLPDEEQAAL